VKISNPAEEYNTDPDAGKEFAAANLCEVQLRYAFLDAASRWKTMEKSPPRCVDSWLASIKRSFSTESAHDIPYEDM
jgi:hypothetical protein